MVLGLITTDVEDDFLNAAKLGELSKLENIMKVYGNEVLKSINFAKNNALHLSACFGTLEGTEFLVEKHDFDISDSSPKSGQNAFLYAATGGKKDQMEYFVKINPDILKSVDSDEFNALHLSARFGTLEGTKFLVETHDFDIFDNSNKFGRNAFLLSAEGGKKDQMEYLVKINPDILKSVNPEKYNALHLSSRFGTLEGTKFLVEKHDFDSFDRSNKHSLNATELARMNRESDQVEYLLRLC